VTDPDSGGRQAKSGKEIPRMTHIPKERSREYDTSEPNPLGDVLSQLFARRGYGRVRGEGQLHALWNGIVGEELARRTRVMMLKNGVLHVGVANSALLSELASFRKGELIEQLNAADGQLKIRDLKFRLRGDLNASSRSR
jgi:predicted nucleic acid-binding Zn ribbon protein